MKQNIIIVITIILFSSIFLTASSLEKIEYGTLKINRELINNNKLKIFFIDVDQGDASIIITPEKKVYLVDAGFWGAGELIIKPILDKLNIDTIDKMFISHAHGDHHAGTMFLIKAFNVKKLYDPGLDVTSESYKEILELAIQHNVDYIIPTANTVIYENDDFKITVLQNDISKLKSSGINNNSMVVAFKYKEFQVLFTGDIEMQAESYLVRNTIFPLKSNVIKVPHHGSGTSNTANFLKEVNPEVGIISVGHNNRYRHPSNAIVRRYENYGEVLRTDRHGNIYIETDGKTYRIQTELENRFGNEEVNEMVSKAWNNIWREKNIKKGIELLQEAYQIEPENPEINSKLGYALMSDTQYEQAEIHLKKAIKLDPQDYYARTNLAKIYQSREDKEKAIAILKEAVLIERHGRDMSGIYKWIESLKAEE
jgi:competence protein ComEC